jgi:hypothetical protein
MRSSHNAKQDSERVNIKDDDIYNTSQHQTAWPRQIEHLCTNWYPALKLSRLRDWQNFGLGCAPSRMVISLTLQVLEARGVQDLRSFATCRCDPVGLANHVPSSH